jgi:ABC-type multidrug transport system ATPase subunit
MIQVEALTKTYGKQTVVDHISFNVKECDIFGLLGPNGAGKTTTIKMICGIIECDDGTITLNDSPLNKSKKQIGYVSQYFGLYEELSVWENIQFYASLYEVDDNSYLMKLLDRYDLKKFLERPAGALSGGYQRRLSLCCALAHDPKILFLDEPTAGIDPVTRKLLWDDFYRLSSEGKTLFVTTHYMEEAQRCNQLAFLSKGKIVAEGSPQDISGALGDVDLYSCHLNYHPEVHEKLKALSDVQLINQFGDELRIIANRSFHLKTFKDILKSSKIQDTEIKKSKPNIEDIFVALTQDGVSEND